MSQLTHEIAERQWCGEIERADAASLRDVGRGKHERRDASSLRVACDRKRAAHRPQTAVEAELAHEHSLRNGTTLELASGDQNTDSDRQIERRALLPDVGGRQVYRDASRRYLESGIDERRTDPLAAFLDRARGQPDNRPLWKSLRRVNLDDDIICVNADESSRTNRSKHRES